MGFRPKLQVGLKVERICISAEVRVVGKGVYDSWGDLLVIGETPDEAADDVANPEDCLDQHWLVVFFAHPVVL